MPYDSICFVDISIFLFYFQHLYNDLARSPDTLEDLKFVLSIIAKIRDIQLNVELRIVDIQERYRTLCMYKIEVLDICVHTCYNVLS